MEGRRRVDNTDARRWWFQPNATLANRTPPFPRAFHTRHRPFTPPYRSSTDCNLSHMSHRDDRSDRGKDDQRATSPGLKMSAEVKEMVLEACNEFVQCVRPRGE